MSATDVCGVSEPNGVRMPPLFAILEKLGWHITTIRGPLGRAEKQIRLNERSQKPIAALELEAEELKKELANYEDLLKLCLDWVRLRTGLSCRQLRKVAFMEEFENEPLDDERGKLAELDRRGETALLWRILWADHRDMVVSVKWPTLESSPPAPETEGQGSKADDEDYRHTKKMNAAKNLVDKPAEPVPANEAIQDKGYVTAIRLADYAGSKDRQIRDVLTNCASTSDSSGRKLWRYCDALPFLRKWCKESTHKKFKAVTWPDIADF